MQPTSKDSIFPYVVPKSWIDSIPADSIVSWQLSEDVHIVLVFDGEGVVRNVRPDDLTTLGLDNSRAFETCAANLARAWEEQKFEFGSATLIDGTRIGLSRGNFMAPAAGFILRNFYESLVADLECSEFVAVAVNQECLFAFPADDKTIASESLRIAIEDEFRGHRKPISKSWLMLDGQWPRPYPGGQRF